MQLFGHRGITLVSVSPQKDTQIVVVNFFSALMYFAWVSGNVYVGLQTLHCRINHSRAETELRKCREMTGKAYYIKGIF